MKFPRSMHISRSMCQSGASCSHQATLKSSGSMEIQMLFSKFKSRMACILKLGRIVLFFIGGTSKILLTNKLSKPFSRQCPMMDLDPRCFSKTTNLELRNSSRVDLLLCGRWEIPWSLRTSHEKFATLISTAKHRRTSTRLRNLIRIIYLFTKL